MFMLLLERNASFLGLLHLTHNLNLNALSPDIVEYQLISRCALVVDSSTNSDLLVLLVLSGLEGAIILDEIPQIIVCMELVGIWVWVLGGSELVDVAGSNLEVLLFTPPSVTMSQFAFEVQDMIIHLDSIPSRQPRHLTSWPQQAWEVLLPHALSSLPPSVSACCASSIRTWRPFRR